MKENKTITPTTMYRLLKSECHLMLFLFNFFHFYSLLKCIEAVLAVTKRLQQKIEPTFL